ncbi:Endonuclease/Exonuclease/phosphatase family protein [Asanoa ishikariensis]|uniref:Endonuclease/Exonuclease/phosphatase family protein n=1 Tax=Asanoa ishikariensis TaxID=137265 RepID=A0A1H3UHT3_9ACTN|nr:endonuclease/exonuclease/phosphatase family protein [Asanoa ishikariensis]SDZ62013.1 Endonuclease/Exonuclease/phosphatase family protein [Asanoa ishikariensis]
MASRRWFVLVAWLLAATALLGGSVAPPARAVRLLQLNLCASGQAGCYTGRSIDVAAQVIRDTRPDVVTLNEICEGDVDTLGSVLAGVHGDLVTSGFRAAPDRPSGGPTRCGRNGQAYGIGLIARRPTTPHEVVGGEYPVQDPVDPEERVWLCLLAAVDVCTTHLAGFDSEAALRQCQHLFGVTLPALHRRAGYRPTIVAGDLNLRYGAPPDLRPCIPPGYRWLGDGGLQHVLATSDLAQPTMRPVDLDRSTDHPGLLVTVGLTSTT